MFRQYRKIESGEQILAGYDLAMGGPDYSAVQFFSKTKLDVPLVYHAQAIATEATNELVPVLEKIHDATGVSPIIAPERNSGGVFEIERMVAMNRLNKYQIYMEQVGIGSIDNPAPKRYGWTTSTATRSKMLEDLKHAIDHQLIRIYDKPTVNEMFAFVIKQTSSAWKAQAETGAHDDLIMALAIAYQLHLDDRLAIKSEAEWSRAIEDLPDENLFGRRGFY